MAHTPQIPVIGVMGDDYESVRACADAIERAGGQPWTALPNDAPLTEDSLAHMGGLVVCGAATTQLLKPALEADMPVLCISQGMQALNVALGGTPAQRVAGHGPVEEDGDPVSSYHRIFISPGSKLAAVVGSGGFVRVNSRHHLGVREAQKAPLLMASAYSLEDGVIEALESPDHRWVIGVQFHPERRKELPPHFDRLFVSLTERAQEYVSADS